MIKETFILKDKRVLGESIHLNINKELIKKFELTINTLDPDEGQIPINILGYGEISLVFELVNDPGIAYKRLPIFETVDQVKRHVKAYKIYIGLLKKLGIEVPESEAIWVKNLKGTISLYCAQQKVDPQTIGNKIIQKISKEEVNLFVLRVMRTMKKVWELNQRSSRIKIGLDGQISNWALDGFNPDRPNIVDSNLIYLDTSTPMFRIDGVEAMEAVLFLKSAPSFIRWALKALFLQEVVDRYYDFRLVTIDLIANFFKEQRPDLIPSIIETINNFFENEVPRLNIERISFEEVKKYYDEDKQIWVIFQNARRLDRWITTHLLRSQYEFYLPGEIKR
ncbi:MAG: DUF6206 family protein [Candidatus Hodarchaeales archaeon]